MCILQPLVPTSPFCAQRIRGKEIFLFSSFFESVKKMILDKYISYTSLVIGLIIILLVGIALADSSGASSSLLLLFSNTTNKVQAQEQLEQQQQLKTAATIRAVAAVEEKMDLLH